MTPDRINACFEIGGALLIWLNVRRLYADKTVRGVFAPVFVFYTLWGFWNCFFYPAVGQVLSFYAGLGTTFGNLTWCALAWRYRVRAMSEQDKRLIDAVRAVEEAVRRG